MDLNEMHVWFRQYAQQMGMQNVRAILPEQIDVLINTSISDYVNELVRTNIGLTNDRVITDNAKLGQINALRTLMDSANLEFDIDNTPFVRVNSPDWQFAYNGFINGIENMMYLVDLSIQYDFDNTENITSWYPVRIIENMYLADTLQDFILKPRFRSPIATISGGDLNLYIGEGPKGIIITPHILRVDFLKYPRKVQYRQDIPGQTNVDCDLPDYMHVDILKHAVDLYRVAIQGSLYANQQQRQAQQREVGRNNVRPDNEGYQQ